MSSQSVPCISTGTTLNNRYVYKAFTSFIILSRTCSINIATAEFNILELVLVVFSLDKEILKWLSICPKYSRKLPKSFFTTEKNSKTKTSPQNEENVFLLIRMTQEDESQVEKLQVRPM